MRANADHDTAGLMDHLQSQDIVCMPFHAAVIHIHTTVILSIAFLLVGLLLIPTSVSRTGSLPGDSLIASPGKVRLLHDSYHTSTTP